MRQPNRPRPLQGLSKLKALSERVKQAQKRKSSTPPHKGRGTIIGLAYRLSIELVVTVFVCGFIGWWMDKWFSTAPLFLLLMLIMGMVAGIINVIRVARDMQNRMQFETIEAEADKNADENADGNAEADKNDAESKQASE